jgi:glucoamylase
VKLTADHIRAAGPATSAERWEEVGGQSPSTIAAEIAGLVAAGDLARRNGDPGSAAAYEATADSWRAQLDSWTFTTTGTFGDHRYYERIDSGYNPDDTATLCFKAGCYWERDVVDGGFLELVRLGVRPADYPDIVGSLPELDATTAEPNTKVTIAGHGDYWHRYNHDSYGEDAAGYGWTGDGNRPTTTGRPWPLLSGERGEYSLALDHNPAHAAPYLRAMANAAGDASYLIPEQVWDRADTTANGVSLVGGEHTGSATPLAWATAQYVRLALGMDAGRAVETPAVVAGRYQGR